MWLASHIRLELTMFISFTRIDLVSLGRVSIIQPGGNWQSLMHQAVDVDRQEDERVAAAVAPISSPRAV